MGKLLLGHCIEHIALILGGVFCPLQAPAAGILIVADMGIMAGHDHVIPILLRPLPETSELHISIAVDAWIRSPASQILIHEPVHDPAAKLIHKVQDLKLHPERFGDRPRILHVIQTAAGILLRQMDSRIVKQTHGASCALISLLNHKSGGDRTVDASAHCNQCFFLQMKPLTVLCLTQFSADLRCYDLDRDNHQEDDALDCVVDQ